MANGLFNFGDRSIYDNTGAYDTMQPTQTMQPPQAGLLSPKGGQGAVSGIGERGKGILGSLFGAIGNAVRRPDFGDRLVLATGGLQMFPNEQAMAMARENINRRRAEEQQMMQANSIAEQFKSMGRPELAEFISANPQYAPEFLSQYMQQQYFPEPTEQWTTFIGEDGRLYRQEQSTGKVEAVGGGQTTYYMGPEQGIRTGTIPEGYYLDESDPSNPQLKLISGSPQEQELIQQQQQAESSKTGQAVLQTREAGIVSEDLSRLTDLIANQGFFTAVTGPMGTVYDLLPATPRRDALRLTDTIKANIGFNRLQQMREASPTGGALGQVSNQELNTLQSVLGSLNLDQSDTQLLYNIERLEGLYNEIMKKFAHYENANEFMSEAEIQYFKGAPEFTPDYISRSQEDPLGLF